MDPERLFKKKSFYISVLLAATVSHLRMLGLQSATSVVRFRPKKSHTGAVQSQYSLKQKDPKPKANLNLKPPQPTCRAYISGKAGKADQCSGLSFLFLRGLLPDENGLFIVVKLH